MIGEHANFMRTAIAALMAFAAVPCRAEQNESNSTNFISSWLEMVGRSQSEQPRWITPLATVTPRLEQEVRLDGFSQSLNSHGRLINYGGGKGIEFIPTESTELFIGIPPYDTRRSRTGGSLADGWGDWPVFLVKYRFVSANEETGNYVVSGFLQLSAPTGNSAFSNRFYVVQPTLAFGKGWGDFDIQTTVSEQIPTGGVDIAERNFGHPVLINVAAQFHIWDFLWPELEANTTWWPDGTRGGKVQLFLTPGVIFGRFEIRDRVRLILGVGYQVAVSPAEPSYRNNVTHTANNVLASKFPSRESDRFWRKAVVPIRKANDRNALGTGRSRPPLVGLRRTFWDRNDNWWLSLMRVHKRSRISGAGSNP